MRAEWLHPTPRSMAVAMALVMVLTSIKLAGHVDVSYIGRIPKRNVNESL